jgi:hypothetical protein
MLSYLNALYATWVLRVVRGVINSVVLFSITHLHIQYNQLVTQIAGAKYGV